MLVIILSYEYFFISPFSFSFPLPVVRLLISGHSRA